ncbi:hypothetical protein [Halodesulfovibrio marinisediminis]|uniref:hypothetical protein n=1 Tax=Halodesulfovibrio marinisediminis TaxID=458711 RepID=UPI00094187C2|nr:hypothetical protein [Halodesulfovibrio marinisediminis]
MEKESDFMRKKNKYIILTVPYLSLAVIMQSNDSEACSRIVVDTPHHGRIVSRTLDWSKELGEIAEVFV